MDKGTLDTICMWGVNSRSAVKVHYEPSRGIICGEGVLAVVCPPGPLRKLDCPWLNPYLLCPSPDGLSPAGSDQLLPIYT